MAAAGPVDNEFVEAVWPQGGEAADFMLLSDSDFDALISDEFLLYLALIDNTNQIGAYTIVLFFLFSRGVEL